MAKTLFDHINHIQTQQQIDYFDELDDVDKKTFNVYMINRFLSMESSYLEIVNTIQKFQSLSPRDVYLFYSNLLPKKSVYNKYIKSNKEAKYESELVELLAHHYKISQAHAIEYLDIFFINDEKKNSLREILESYGWDKKRIKKVGL